MEEEKGMNDVEYSYSIKFTWKIKNFSTINTEKLYSDVFAGGDHKWRILIYPKGRNYDNILWMYLDVADSVTLPNGWTRRVKYSLSIISELDKNTVKTESEKTFNASKSRWGVPSFMSLKKLCNVDQRFLVRDTCTVRAEVWFNEENCKEEPNVKDGVDLNPVKCTPSFTKFDTLFTEIENGIQEMPTCGNFSDKEIADARTIYEKCLDMDLISIVRSDRALALKNAVSILLDAKAIPDSMVDESAKFVANFDQHIEKYEAAERDLSDAQEDEDSVSELKTNLKQLSSKFMPVRKQAEAVDSEIDRLEKLLGERRAKRTRLGKRLDDLAEQAATWKQALFCTEQRMNVSAIKKGEAEKTISEFQVPWESLRALHSVNIGAVDNAVNMIGEENTKTKKTRARPANQQPRNLRSRTRLHET